MDKPSSCLVCNGELPEPGINGGRPRIYCSLLCRRTAERRASRHRASVLWAKAWLRTSPAAIATMTAAYGAKAVETRTQIARDILAAEQVIQAREAGVNHQTV